MPENSTNDSMMTENQNNSKQIEQVEEPIPILNQVGKVSDRVKV